MASYMDEEEIFKCPTHPSKRRRTGICPTCLRDRLNTLCPYCGNLRPCACCPAAVAASTSSSSTSSFSFFSSTSSGDGEPSMRRSRSVAIPFLRSRSKYAPNLEFVDQKPPASNQKPPLPQASDQKLPPPPESDQKLPLPPASDQRPPSGSNRGKSTSLLSIFKSKSKRFGAEERENEELSKKNNDFAWMMNRSRSVSVPMSLNSGSGGNKSSTKGRGWHFPSPMKAFRQSKTSKVLQEQQAAMVN